MAFAVSFGFGGRDAAERRPRNRRSGDVWSYVAIAECVVPTLVPKPKSLTVTQGNLRCQESAAKRLVRLPWVMWGRGICLLKIRVSGVRITAWPPIQLVTDDLLAINSLQICPRAYHGIHAYRSATDRPSALTRPFPS